jgi:hypothetical protein
MNAPDAQQQLHSSYSQQNRKIYPRHVTSYAGLNKWKKDVGPDQFLAADLWHSGRSYIAKVSARKKACA